MTENNKKALSSSSAEMSEMTLDQVQDSANEQCESSDAHKWLLATRERMLSINPISMEEIDRIIHDGR